MIYWEPPYVENNKIWVQVGMTLAAAETEPDAQYLAVAIANPNHPPALPNSQATALFFRVGEIDYCLLYAFIRRLDRLRMVVTLAHEWYAALPEFYLKEVQLARHESA